MGQNMNQNMNQNMDENMINMIRMRMLSEHCSPATRRSSLGSSASATRIGVSSSRLFTHRLHVYNEISLKFVHFTMRYCLSPSSSPWWESGRMGDVMCCLLSSCSWRLSCCYIFEYYLYVEIFKCKPAGIDGWQGCVDRGDASRAFRPLLLLLSRVVHPAVCVCNIFICIQISNFRFRYSNIFGRWYWVAVCLQHIHINISPRDSSTQNLNSSYF